MSCSEARRVLLPSLGRSHNHRRLTVGLLHEEAHLAADPFGPLGETKCAQPPDTQAKRVSSVRTEQGRLVPKRVVVGIVREHRAVVTPALAGNGSQPLTSHTDQLGSIVRRIVHWGNAVAPCPFAVTHIEPVQSRVLVFRLAVEQFTEPFLVVELARGDDLGLVVAGLAQHVDQSVLFDRITEELTVVQRPPGGRHGREYVLAMPHGQFNVFGVKRPVSENGDGVDLIIEHHLFE